MANWANSDPQRAASVIAQLPAWLRRATRPRRTSRVAGRKTIPRPRSAWTHTLPAGEGQKRALQSVLSSWAESEPSAAADYVAGLPIGPAQDEAVKAIAQQLATTDVQSAISWAEKLPEGATRQDALNPIIAHWSEADPGAAAEYTLSHVNGEMRQSLLETVSRQWAQNDPQAAVAWAEGLSDPAARASVMPNIISVVAENDPGAAAQMINRLSGQAQADAVGNVDHAVGWQRPGCGERVGSFFSRRPGARSGSARLDAALVGGRRERGRELARPFNRQSVARPGGEQLSPIASAAPIPWRRCNGRRRLATRECATARRNRLRAPG